MVTADVSTEAQRRGIIAILVREEIMFNSRPDITNLSIEYVIECSAIEIKPNIILITKGLTEIYGYFIVFCYLLRFKIIITKRVT